METPHPSLASVKMTDPLASYASNRSLDLKFYNRMSVLAKSLATNG